MATTDDIEDLIARVALADRSSFDRLYELTSAKLFGVCLRVLKDRAEAEDVLQDIFVTIWQKADRYAANGLSPMTWLITIARNRAIDRLRARRVPVETPDVVAEMRDPAPGPEAAAIAGGELARITACFDELEADRAQAVRGAYLEGETYADLAEKFGVPVNTMRTWLRRSLIKLKECLSR
ncbi:sigma-70 family RNA polymerase sigma factor [Aliiroseovarius sp. YM-037]|uniref:sigma-70 family RNA polymerase sigma factor n=1 Tax=Aliiroseovarius sp. YM-037 TaxID=3341728 RepID=UPI003A809CC5